MDEAPRTDVIRGHQAADTSLVEETSTEYLGRWNRLVSTTNWEKGRIIAEWREALIEAGAPPASYTDEAWSRRVGNVTAQHTGRLRRVYQRFGDTYEQYPGLYWSHFQAALDWPDAEMWLEGAVQNGWSVARMRHQRWEAIGAPADKKPREEDIITAELDEDVDPAGDQRVPELISDSLGVVRDAEPPARGESEEQAGVADAAVASEPPGSPAREATVEPFRPFEDLPRLPPDLNEAFEALKLAVLHHKRSGWKEVSLGDVLAALDALRRLATAPRKPSRLCFSTTSRRNPTC